MKIRIGKMGIVLSLALMSAYSWAQAPNRCPSIQFYGNAFVSGLCKNISQPDQNLLVCELTSAQPDVHLTFGLNPNGVNPPAALHLTVRTQSNSCDGSTNINVNAGVFAVANNAAICGVNPGNYAQRMNAVPQVNVPAGQSACTRPFLTAQGQGKLSPQQVQGYINVCNTGGANNTACP